MDSQNDQNPGETDTDGTDLKGSLLVVGTVPDIRFGEVIQWVLGKSDTPARKRVIVTSSGVNLHIESHLASTLEAQPPEDTQIISLRGKEETSPAEKDFTGHSIPTREIDAHKIDALGQEILQTVESFEAEHGELEPGELVVSFQQLSDLIDIHGQEAVFQLVHLLNHLFEERSGIALYHLPVERESGVVRQFEPLFDEVIELRLQNGDLEGRFSLGETDGSSEWVEL